MKQTITFSMFVDAFRNADRKDHFSYEALKLIFNDKEDNDYTYDLDVVVICCDYVEADFEQIQADYGLEGMDRREVSEYLQNETTVIGEVEDRVVFLAF